MRIILWDDAAAPQRRECELADFLLDNIDFLSDDERRQLVHCVMHGFPFVGGGGASPTWRIEPCL